MVSAIVLAAGSSERMGEMNKLTLPFKSSSMIQYIVDQIRASKAEKTIVVTGHEENLIQLILKGSEVICKHNPDYPQGLTSSIQTGVAHAESKGFMICLADMIKLTTSDYNLIIEAFEKSFSPHDPCIIVPRFNGKTGNPVIFSFHFKAMILSNKNPNGCKNIIEESRKFIRYADLPNDHIFVDIDYPDDYSKWAK